MLPELASESGKTRKWKGGHRVAIEKSTALSSLGLLPSLNSESEGRGICSASFGACGVPLLTFCHGAPPSFPTPSSHIPSGRSPAVSLSQRHRGGDCPFPAIASLVSPILPCCPKLPT